MQDSLRLPLLCLLLLPALLANTARAEKPVELVEVHVRTEITGSLALTTTELLFHNPNGRIMEKALQFPLLEGQSVVRFAMDVSGKLREAVPVEKNKGQMVFEAIERRRVDPGLLEKTEGNNYRARIYPIPAGGNKRVVIATLEEILPGSKQQGVYSLPLDYGQLKQFSLKLRVNGPKSEPIVSVQGMEGLSLPDWREQWETATTKADFKASGLIRIQLPALAKPEAFTTEHDGKTYFYLPIEVPAAKAERREKPQGLAVLWDASGSGERREHELEIRLLEAYIREHQLERVELIRLRNELESPITFEIEDGDTRALNQALRDTTYDGATNFSALEQAANRTKNIDTFLLFSDGLSNFGAGDFELPDVTCFTINSAIRSDPARLKQIAQASGGTFIDLLSNSHEEALKALLTSGQQLLLVDYKPTELAHVYPAEKSAVSGILGITGILRKESAKLRLAIGKPGSKPQPFEVLIERREGHSELAARAWATAKIAALEVNYQANQEDIRRTGRDFGIVTKNTSLIILDTIEDYVRYEIRPPGELAEAYDRLISNRRDTRSKATRSQIEKVVQLFRQKQQWYAKDFPKDKPKQILRKHKRGQVLAMSAPMESLDESVEEESVHAFRAEPRASSVPATAATGAPAPAPAATLGASINPAFGNAFADGEAGDLQLRHAERVKPDQSLSTVRIQLQKWDPDAGYLDHLRRTSDKALYKAYLEERPDYQHSTAFYLDCHDYFLEREQPALALRILSNLAEMDLENHAILRVLAYRLTQSGHAKLAIPLFERVKVLRAEEPQSYRDLALACTEVGESQRAVDLLWHLISHPWDSRFPEIELIALAELNHLLATSEELLDRSKIDPRLIENQPLELRVLLGWDADNTDIDLWVIDPNGQKCYYEAPLSYQGGRMSRDFTGGYGPEEFSLKVAKPGTYTVMAHYYGSRQQDVMGPATLQLNLQRNFGTERSSEERITLRLLKKDQEIEVGTFTVE